MREILESLGFMAPPRADTNFNLGATIANLRGLNTSARPQTRTLVDSRDVRDEDAGASEAAEQVDAAKPTDAASAETESGDETPEASNQNPISTEE
jgi:hypothetical protein